MEVSGPDMTFRVETGEDGVSVVTISGELDIANVDDLERAVAPVIERSPERLVLELTDLRFADSSAIALWVRWAASVGSIELRHCSPLLRRVIESMGLDGKLRLTG